MNGWYRDCQRVVGSLAAPMDPNSRNGRQLVLVLVPVPADRPRCNRCLESGTRDGFRLAERLEWMYLSASG